MVRITFSAILSVVLVNPVQAFAQGLPADGNGSTESTAAFELETDTEVVVRGHGSAYNWGPGGEINSSLLINGEECVSNRRYVIPPWTGTQTVDSSCFLLAKAGTKYWVEHKVGNRLGSPRNAAVSAVKYDPVFNVMARTSALGSAEVRIDTFRDREVTIIASSQVRGFLNNDNKTVPMWHELEILING